MADSKHNPVSTDHPDGAVITPCLCASLRRASRVMTRRYDQYLKPAGLRITQYSMLATIMRHPGVTVSGLSKMMVLEQTTVTRNLQNLIKAGYIRLEHQEGDQRTKQIYLSPNGEASLEAARPLWEKAQANMEKTLGKLGMTLVMQSLNTVIE